jgi:hypothetical protein
MAREHLSVLSDRTFEARTVRWIRVVSDRAHWLAPTNALAEVVER